MAACWEADTYYPVPRRMSQEACEQLIRQALPKPGQFRRRTRRYVVKAFVEEIRAIHWRGGLSPG